MQILVKRIAKKETYTIGKLYVDGKYFCDTLEDKDRGLYANMTVEDIKKKKVYGKTAIPYGDYDITLNVLSDKYSKKPTYKSFTGGYMPRLLAVKGFDGILIHGGNTPEDTYGCILVGENKVVGKLINSLTTFKRLYTAMSAVWEVGEKINLIIE